MYGRFTYIRSIFVVNVGTYSSTMDHLGYKCILNQAKTSVAMSHLNQRYVKSVKSRSRIQTLCEVSCLSTDPQGDSFRVPAVG